MEINRTQTSDNNTVFIHFTDKVVSLKISDFDTELDPDVLLAIDYNNILGEILTFPVILNRIGILRAEMNDYLQRSRFDNNIYKAQLTERLRKIHTVKLTGARGAEKIEKPGSTELENAVYLDPAYQNKMKEEYRIQKEYEYIDSIYWAAKSKDDKLKHFSSKLHPDDLSKDLVEGAYNGVLIRIHKKIL